jgi:phage FluMu gp28-like protein
VLELLGDVLVTRWIETMQKMRLPDQQKIVDTIIGLPGMRRGLIDETGMGLAVKEFSEDRFGSIRIGGVTFTGPARVEMSKHLQAKFQDRKIRIPNDPMIRDDLRLVKKEDTLSSERIVIEEGGESHADRFWALALAIYAAYEWTTSGSRAPATAPTSVSPSHLTGRINQPNVSLAAKLLTRAA